MQFEDANKSLNPISIVRASAGTGKTFCLTEEFANVLLPSQNSLLSVQDVGPLQIIATTFTNKAADELLQRIQSHLISRGSYELAKLIRGSYIGTINSICGRLVSEYALEGGLSPSIKVLDETRQRKVFLACSEGPLGVSSERLSELAYRLSIDDWRRDVLHVVELSRQNDISRRDLLSVAEQSWNRLSQLLPDPLPDEGAEALDAELMYAIQTAIDRLKRIDDDTKVTQETLEFLNVVSAALKKQQIMPWANWARISKLKAASKSQSELSRLKAVASRYLRHPRLRSDWREMIHDVISCALKCMDEYSSFKSEHGLIDFVDQEVLAKSLLDSQVISDELGERFKILMVDEFQDTSPIQLSVFLKMAESVRGSLWVGDVKQAIFGFRGADPELMRELSALLVPETGGTESNLNTSFRSRPELVSFSNALFSACMPPIGIPEEVVRISDAARRVSSEMEAPIHFWWLTGKTFEETLVSMSAGLLATLNDAERFLVQDKTTGNLRPIVGSDIAVLCRSNEHRLQVSTQFASAGLQVATERSGLLDTPECVLAVAALRFMVDPYDTLAAGILVRFVCSGEEWLSQCLQDGFVEFAESVPIIRTISQNRSRLTHLTPLETMELAIVGSGIVEIIKGLGGFRQRAINLDALRGLAREYEDDCLATGRAATAAGLVASLHKRALDPIQPQNPGRQAVNVLTYHKAKGLEWPFVVLFDLDDVKVGTAFGVTIEQKIKVDVRTPLKGRVLRYWPYPYGRQRVDVDLGSTPGSYEAQVASKKTRSELIRLMYVGVTRARDYLVFAARHTTGGVDWLNQLKDKDGRSIISVPFSDGRHPILRDNLAVHFAEMKILNSSECQLRSSDRVSIYTTPQPFTQRAKNIPYRIAPSKMETVDVHNGIYAVSERIILGERIALPGHDPIQRLGEVVHCFFAADDCDQPVSERMQLGRELLYRWDVTSLRPFDLVTMANRLRDALEEKFPGARKFCECPVNGFWDLQRMRGSIDLLLETSDGYVVIDHKTYPGRMSSWSERVLTHASQLYAYKKLIEDSCSIPVIGCFLHLPLLGQLFKISVRE